MRHRAVSPDRPGTGGWARKPIRIGVDARPMKWAGIGRVIAQLLRHLAAADQDNSYVVYYSPEQVEGMPSGLGANFSLVAVRAGVHTLSEQALLAHRIRRDGLDVFHASTSLVVPVLSPAPLVVTVHDLLLTLRPEHLESRLGRVYLSLMHPLALRRAHTLVAVSDFTRGEIARLRSGLEARTRTVHNGISPVFRPGAPTEASRALLLRLGIDRRFVLYVGTLKRHKNVPTLIAAFAAMREELHRGVKLVLVTRQDERYPEVPRLVEEKGLAESVIFVGGLSDEDLADLYRGADLLAMPSTYEGFGLPVAEAMACATPIAASDIPVFHEVAGDAAAYFDPTEPASIASTLERLLDDSAQREALARRGVDRASRYSWARAAREMRDVYERAAKRGSDTASAG